jgi:hypothetical protein
MFSNLELRIIGLATISLIILLIITAIIYYAPRPSVDDDPQIGTPLVGNDPDQEPRNYLGREEEE